ncbi:hypothetical protein [Streptomyces chartreusis]|uniref:hypothetical protein n=1 Tax=Streptomyces chartreusis TaxID=1969 RepID=UPI003651C678
MFHFAAVADDGSAALAWFLVATLAAVAVFLVGFFGSQKPKPVGLDLGFYPALFLGSGGGAITFFGLLTVFAARGLF